jgi:hypothetical protein
VAVAAKSLLDQRVSALFVDRVVDSIATAE